MGRTFTLALAFGVVTLAFGQQGGMGQRLNSEDSIRGLEGALATYLNGDEIKNVLTPGEFSEWTLNLKAGQVVIAEARSDAFDPALEIVDDKNKVLASNDDRYPGDQRPLLMWRCEQDGAYAIHARCFHDKSGGQFFLRFKTYDSVALSSGQMVEHDVDGNSQILLKVPMKAGEIKTFISDSGGPNRYIRFETGAVIAPGGLPDVDLARSVNSVIHAFMAPVAGDYYVLASPNGRGKIHAGTQDIVAQKLIKSGDLYSSKAPTNAPALWELSVKKGDFLQITTPELDLVPQLILAEEPDISKFDLAKPETNPFFPQSSDKQPHLGPAFDSLPGRARDGRIMVFYALRDATLWIASDGRGKANTQFTLNVAPAAASYVADKANTGNLRIGNTDYWAFDAQAGDVMTLDTTAPGFSEQVTVREPDLTEIRGTTAGPDQTSDSWQMVVQKPGRYLVAVSCMGDGGGGAYTLSRKVLHAKEFSKGSPAEAEIANGEIQVWKFTAKPTDPLLIHWKASAEAYTVAIYDDKGQQTDFDRRDMDGHNRFGILKVDQPRTYLIVLTGNGAKSSYSIELNDIPGYKAGK